MPPPLLRIPFVEFEPTAKLFLSRTSPPAPLVSPPSFNLKLTEPRSLHVGLYSSSSSGTALVNQFQDSQTSLPDMTFASAPASGSGSGLPTQLCVTEEILSKLLDKVLSVFDVEGISRGGENPPHAIQRECGPEESSPRFKLRPMSGNDFDIESNMTISPSWEAILQLDRHDKNHSDKAPYDGSSRSLFLHSEANRRLLIQFTKCKLQPMAEEVALQHIRQAASLLDSAWPDATLGPSRRRQLGPAFSDPESLDYVLSRWLASKQLNPVYEGVFVKDLFVLDGALLQVLRKKEVSSETKTERGLSLPRIVC